LQGIKKWIPVFVAISLAFSLLMGTFVEVGTFAASSKNATNESVLDLIPSGGSGSDTWDSNNTQSAIHVNHIALNGDLWDMDNASSGYVTMTDDTSLSTSVNFTSVSYGEYGDQVIGYPNIGYGFSAFGAGSSEWNDPSLNLPAKLSSLSNIILLASYQTSPGNGETPFDFAYDIWITQNLPNGSSTSAPSTGSLELMIWTDHTNGLAPDCVLTLYCTAQQEGSTQLPTAINGVSSNQTWDVWVSNGDESASRQTTVFIVLNNPLASGTVGVDLRGMIEEANNTLSSDFADHWNSSSFGDYWLDYISLGSEFQPDFANMAQYGWNLLGYCLLLNYPALSTQSPTYSCGSNFIQISSDPDSAATMHYTNYFVEIIATGAIALLGLSALAMKRRKKSTP
jgi:hypothetical protein